MHIISYQSSLRAPQCSVVEVRHWCFELSEVVELRSVALSGTSLSASIVAIEAAVRGIDTLQLAYGFKFDLFGLVSGIGIVGVKVNIEIVEVDAVKVGHLDVVVLLEADCEFGGLSRLLSLLVLLAFLAAFFG